MRWTSWAAISTVRRPSVGAARSARPRAELDLPRQLSGRPVRSFQGSVHYHRQCARPHTGCVARPHGSDSARRLHRAGKGDYRVPLLDSAADYGKWPRTGIRHPLQRRGPCASPGSPLHSRGRNAQPGARDRNDLPQTGAAHRRRHAREGGGDFAIVETDLGAPRHRPDEEVAERTKPARRGSGSGVDSGRRRSTFHRSRTHAGRQ